MVLWLFAGEFVLGVVVCEIFARRARKRQAIGWLKVPLENWIEVIGLAITGLVMFVTFRIWASQSGMWSAVSFMGDPFLPPQ